MYFFPSIPLRSFYWITVALYDLGDLRYQFPTQGERISFFLSNNFIDETLEICNQSLSDVSREIIEMSIPIILGKDVIHLRKYIFEFSSESSDSIECYRDSRVSHF